MGFVLNKDDTIFIYKNNHWLDFTKVKGFCALGMYSLTMGPFPFCAGLFYGVGYDSDGTRYLYLKEKNHYKYAVICEKIRLMLPYKIGEKLFKI